MFTYLAKPCRLCVLIFSVVNCGVDSLVSWNLSMPSVLLGCSLLIMEGSTKVHHSTTANISDWDSDSGGKDTVLTQISVDLEQTWVCRCSDISLWDQWTDNEHIVVPIGEDLPNPSCIVKGKAGIYKIYNII